MAALKGTQDPQEPQGRVRGRVAGEPPLPLLRQAGRHRGLPRRRRPVPRHRRGRDRPRARPPRLPEAGRRPGHRQADRLHRQEPGRRRRRRDLRVHRDVPGHGEDRARREASTRSPSGSRRSRRPRSRTPAASRRRSTASRSSSRGAGLEPVKVPPPARRRRSSTSAIPTISTRRSSSASCAASPRSATSAGAACRSAPRSRSSSSSIDATPERGRRRRACAGFEAVNELCYHCKLCYNHCPYTPPHEWDVDFPPLMRRQQVRARSATASRWRAG